MNQDDLFLVLLFLAWGFVLVSQQWTLFWERRRVAALRKELDALHLQFQVLSAAKEGDYTTSRIMAQVAKSNLTSAGALEIEVPKEPKKNTYSLLQSAD